MQIARLQGDTSVTALARRVYGLAATAPQLAAATAALAAANPHLADGTAALPSGTPVVVPPVSGLATAANATTADPRMAALLGVLQTVTKQAEAQLAAAPSAAAQAVLARVQGAAKPLRFTASNLQTLKTDIASLAKQLGS